MTAVSKGQRQRMIAEWLRAHRVGSQEEVVARLALAGLNATQATVSRDLEDLGAVKVRREGSIRYIIPDSAAAGPRGGAARPADRRMGRGDRARGQSAGACAPRRDRPICFASALDAAGWPILPGRSRGTIRSSSRWPTGSTPHAAAARLQARRSGTEPRPGVRR